MKSSFLILLSLCVILLLLESGCTKTSISSLVTSRSNDESRVPSPESQNGKIYTDKQPCRLRYHNLNSTDRNIVVEGKFPDCGNTYPVVLDTGASQPIFLHAALVRKNKLPVLAAEIKNADLNGHTLGFCMLPELTIGEVILSNWSCIYLEPHAVVSLFGIPLASSTYSSDNIIIGLPLLREFKYIELDNINKEVEFSYYHSFEPANETIWKKYPISIEDDFHGNSFLFVNFTIAGRMTELQLDTGSGRGLAIGENLWNQIQNKLKNVNLKRGKDYYPYIGNLPCRRGNAPELELGNRIVKDAEISVFQNDSPLLSGCDGLVGMQYFANTVIVLDFEHDLLWVKTSDI